MRTLLTVTLVALATTAVAQPTTLERMTAVENGLRPAVSFVDDPAWTLKERMEHYGVPAVAIAVIHDGKVAWTRTYGLADRVAGTRAVPTTLFQAGSVSKPVAAFGAMVLAQQGRLALDADVNEQLTSWQLPGNEFTAQQPVTLHHLLSHTGGLTVHGFPGYAPDADVPTVVQVLDGDGPANTDPVRVNMMPGSEWRYSGGGYTIAQLLMTDVAGQEFPALMDDLVLAPIGMSQSTYENPLPPEQLAHAAAGVLPDGSDVLGKRHTYPEMAAAGLWTTGEDLALFAVEVQHAWRGESHVMDRDTAKRMLDPVDAGYSLGFGIDQRGDATYFGHGGWDEGFCARLTAHRDHGYGAVVMINANFPEFMSEVINAVAFEYGWEGYEVHVPQPVPTLALSTAPGRYRYNAELAVKVYREEGRIFLLYAGGEPEELLYVGDNRFMRRGRNAAVIFPEQDGEIVLAFPLGGGEMQIHERLAEGKRLPREYLAEGHFYAALGAYRNLKEREPEEPSVSEEYLNGRGLAALETNVEHGIALLRVAAELYPDSANTWDSLGYAYRQADDTEQAIANYKKALRRDPEFPSALEAMAELTVDTP